MNNSIGLSEVNFISLNQFILKLVDCGIKLVTLNLIFN